MSLESDIADLVTATTTLTDAVNVRKATLDQKVQLAADQYDLAKAEAVKAADSAASAQATSDTLSAAVQAHLDEATAKSGAASNAASAAAGSQQSASDSKDAAANSAADAGGSAKDAAQSATDSIAAAAVYTDFQTAFTSQAASLVQTQAIVAKYHSFA